MKRLIIDLDDTLTDTLTLAAPDGEPWCGLEGFHVDDKSIRPSAFVRHSLPAIHALLAADKAGA